MNRKEVIQLLGIATANFPRLQEKEMKPTAVLWEQSLNDIPYDIAQKALITVLSTSKFFPTIAEIREAVTKITQPRVMDAIEAWNLIVQAIRNYGYIDEKSAMESLPLDVREMAKRFGWRELCLNENPDTLRAQFRMAWETQSKRVKEYQVLPSGIRTLIDGLADNMKLDSGNELKRLKGD